MGYFAHMELNKSETFLKSMPTSSAAINVRFLGVINPKGEFMFIDHCYETYKQMPTACPPDT